ncbi:MAG: class I SAM-dependent methyltransferase [Gammaproteobacteria bacterium]|nr:class I SAM-dependent methyltransferase [Gammaproteobacteria bacterium]TVQ47233.1 MAG: class I SAM-dependent methyltransferase [Gammaproteobacteria bacterium]
MERLPEPELMDDSEQAEAYASADFESANSAFMAHLDTLLAGRPLVGPVLDLGCGPADICLRVARAHPGADIHALDGSEAMLACARRRLGGAPELAGRIRLLHDTLPVEMLPARHYELVMSNSLLHHLHDPAVLWDTLRRFSHSGTRVLVMDLYRPASVAAARSLVETWSGDEPEVLKRDFFNSLLAAFTPEEVEAQLAAAALGTLKVSVVSDRHLLVAGQLP